jgi:macrolide transport system ATP-binding/permease protein
MFWLRLIYTRLYGLLRKNRIEQEMDEELRFHLRMRTRENIERGMRPDEAEREARRRFGNVGHIKDLARDIKGGGLMETLLQDLRYGLRLLMKSPGFTAVAVLSLAICIGANTAFLSLVDQMLLRSLPVENPERLVTFVNAKGSAQQFSHPIYRDLKERNDSLTGLIAQSSMLPISLSAGGQTERIFGQLVSGNYFSVLGVKAARGHFFSSEEDVTPGGHPLVVVSHGLWRQRFGADPGLIGKVINLNGQSFTVIGIAPAGFTGTSRGVSPDVFVPLMMHDQVRPTSKGRLLNRKAIWLSLMGRLKPGVSREQAQAALTLLSKQVASSHPNTDAGRSVFLADGSRGNTDRLSNIYLPLVFLSGAVSLVLLIVCFNVANLLLARAGVRRKEIALRLALGASRGRIIRQLLTESILLSFFGALIGLVITNSLFDLLVAFTPPQDFAPLTLNARFDAKVLGITLILLFLTSILFGLAPAVRSSKSNPIHAIKEDISGLSLGARPLSLRNMLMVAQLALSLVVLVGAGLCLRSLWKLQAIDLGFEPARVIVMMINPILNGYTEARGRQFYSQLVERAAALPGVESVSLTSLVPLGGGINKTSVTIEGYQPQPVENMMLDYSVVGPNYFRTMGIILLGGRDFFVKDDLNQSKVAIINESFARRYFSNGMAIGKQLNLGTGPEDAAEIIGIARDSRNQSLTGISQPMFYLPFTQNYESEMALQIRTTFDSEKIVRAIIRIVASLDAGLPVYNIRTLTEQKERALYTERIAATFLGSFGLITLLLVALGLYGVIAYSVTQRTREIGIRIALGANRLNIYQLIVGEGVWVIVTGLLIGLAGAFVATRVLSNFLYGVETTDSITYIGVSAVLAIVALVASYVPARRATRIDSMVAIRYE